MISETALPVTAGSYLLWYFLPKGRVISVGSLGARSFRRGWYGYCGSAFGPGGLRARLRHHLAAPRRPHWHIDYFKTQARLRQLWFCAGHNFEHTWSTELVSLAEGTWPCPGFGSSDCRCVSHLVCLPAAPAVTQAYHALADRAPITRLRRS